MGLIYKIVNQQTNKVYIGKTIRNLDVRKKEHLRDYLIEDNKLYRAMRKYGPENFEFEIVEDQIDNAQLGMKEKYYIKKYNSYYEGYNSTFGGEGESAVDEEQILLLFSQGYNCVDIESLTKHTKKTIASVLKRNGIEIPQHTGKNSQGKNGSEVKVVYLDKVYDSITELAIFLKENEEEFHDKRKQTIIQGISRSLKNNSCYFNHHFKYYSS